MSYINNMSGQRHTKYTQAAKDYMGQFGHATNLDILKVLRINYPELSATTVHRITSRMLDRNELIIGPPSKDNSLRLDANLSPHDHFQCRLCDRLRDIQLPKSLFESIQKLVGDCNISGRLTIQGTCDKCLKSKEEMI